MKRILINLLFFLLLYSASAQDLSGHLEDYLGMLVDGLPGSNANDYHEATVNEAATWSEAFQSYLDGEFETAREKAGEVNYQIIAYTDQTTGRTFDIFQEKNPQQNYWGIYIFDRAPLRPELVLQAPHPKYDTNTGYQCIYCFTRLSARALFISGTHRCNSTTVSPCSGTTTACDASYMPFRQSDNAHNSASIFQKSTEILYLDEHDPVFVQLHGFAKTSGDPYLIMSSGSRIVPDPDFLSLIKVKLLEADPELTFRISHIDLDWTRLLAFTNTQGRFINGSNDPCSQDASETSGRFIHIEQEKSRLRQDESGWEKMRYALENVFPADSGSTGIELADSRLCRIFPNPSRGQLTFELEAPADIRIYNLSGILVEQRSASSRSFTLDLKELDNGLYIIRIDSGIKRQYEKILLMKE